MEPITGFVSIVGLIAQYSSEVKSKKIKEDTLFQKWLEDNRWTDVIDLLSRDSQTLHAVEELLNDDREMLEQKLTAIEEALLKFSSAVDGFDKISASMKPNLGLSEQALSILIQMEDKQVEALLRSESNQGRVLSIISGPNPGDLDLPEIRYLDSDLKTLTDLGLLLQDRNGKGQLLFIITREASKLVRKLEANS